MAGEHNHRHLVLEGAFNMRDLGDVPTADGYTVCTGRLFRSDALHNLTIADLQVLSIYGIASVIDLRREDEAARFGVARLTNHGARHIHLPLMGNEPLHDQAGFPPMGEIYTMIAEKWPERFVRVLETLSRPETLPAVFHCAAGKDRTGMTAALIYSILGVERDLIVADYVLTDAAMDRILEAERQAAPAQDGPAVEHPSGYTRAEAITMNTFLDALDEQYGSPEAWLKHHGLPESAIDSLRRELLI